MSDAPAGAGGEADTPLVDLTALVRQLHEQADRDRTRALRFTQLAEQLRREADYHEQLAATLGG